MFYLGQVDSYKSGINMIWKT